jgi:hypothetical protein
MINEIGIEVHADTESTDRDPYLLTGYGVYSYLQALVFLFKMFVVITIVCIPILALNAGHSFYELRYDYVSDSSFSFFINLEKFGEQMTLGNFGGATKFCV